MKKVEEITTEPVLEVEIKQEHIDKGIKSDDECCALSLAIKEKTNAMQVYVTYHYDIHVIYSENKNGRIVTCERYKHSPESLKFIEEYDQCLPVQPKKINLLKILS